tara:strand:+ start:9609 stop:9806 length:198 start_codon:yes stop_codon:yes gene_type:complete
MNWLIQKIIKSVGVGYLLRAAWSSVKPRLEAWAESDGEDDWDDALVKVIDEIVNSIAGKIDEEDR